MSAFDRLDPLVQHHIVNSLGWRKLRPLQDQSIDPILNGLHCLLLAPTAGGKTEAAMFPVFSQMITERWGGLSVVYICPLKALLNNLHERLSHYAALLGRRCEVWHGDISGSRKERARNSPPHILLTTPESLEGMLISVNPLNREMLSAIHCVIIDEVHVFAGSDRGWHLLSLLERIGRLSSRELQRIGLSATVGNPEELLKWLAGHCSGGRAVVAPPTGTAEPPEVTLDYVSSLDNAAVVISRLYRGEKRLVFCDSRSRVEELAGSLRRGGVETYLSHSSLSVNERRAAEKAFSESRNCVIVSTSTLELGIDVGDLDRVIQIDAPNSVSSFLQRLGRSGRREGERRNCLMLATSERALLHSIGLLELWRSGFVEPVVAPAQPLHIFSQQLMALALQLGGLPVNEWHVWIGRLPPFAALENSQGREIIEFLKEKRILFEDEGLLGFGPEGEARFGRRHFLEILSIFISPSTLTAFHAGRELGQVELKFLLRRQDDHPTCIALGGHSWIVRNVNWRARQLTVEPSDEKARGAWIGTGQGFSQPIASMVKSVLMSAIVPSYWSIRTRSAMERIRSSCSYLRRDKHVLLVQASTGRSQWLNFAGEEINELISSHLERATGIVSHPNDLGLVFPSLNKQAQLLEKLHELEVAELLGQIVFDVQAIESLKFYECLPVSLCKTVLEQRVADRNSIELTLSQRTVLISEVV